MPSYPFTYSPQPLNVTPVTIGTTNSGAVSLPPRSADMAVTFHIKFTLGSLTNAVFTVQALNPDGSTWQSLVGAQYASGTLTASTNLSISAMVPGAKQLRVQVVTTGAANTS